MSRPARLPGLLSAPDLERRGLSRRRIQTMLRHGDIIRVARGLYRRKDAPLTELETVAAVSKRIPGGVICLLTALHIHEIGTQAPRDVWIAIDRKAWKPRASDLPVHVVRFSGKMLRYGVDTRVVLGVSVRITAAARTVVDCFRYRRKIGLDVAIEALRDAIRSRRVTADQIDRVAAMCRIRSVVRPYLQALIS